MKGSSLSATLLPVRQHITRRHVLSPDLPALWRSRSHGLRLRWRAQPPPARAPDAARARHLQLLPPQRGRRAARVVVPPLGLPRLVHRRARHPHQRRALDGAPRGGTPGVMTRLPQQPGERIDRSTSVGFTFDGRRVDALAGDTIASALYAAGQRTFSRSFKYHRRRGLLCCAGQCPNCLVAVDGAPGVRACTEPVREGMAVEHLNASPSLEHDVMAVTDPGRGPFTPPGLFYKNFIPPPRPLALFEEGVRPAAGAGKAPARPGGRRGGAQERRP